MRDGVKVSTVGSWSISFGSIPNFAVLIIIKFYPIIQGGIW
jgi:hypothetical protein